MNKENYFSTVEFAKLVGTTKDTLFHYDKIGIFSPEIKLGNNYRYYSTNQIEIFLVICILKELGLPLKEIKEYLQKRNGKNLVKLLEDKKREIDEKIDHLNRMKDFICEKSEITKATLDISSDKVYIESVEKDLLFTTEVCDINNEKRIAMSIGNHMNNCKSNNIKLPYSIGNMIDIKSINEEKYDNYQYFFTKISEKEYLKIYNKKEISYNEEIFNNNFHLKPSGMYLIAYHNKGYSSINKTYKKIMKFAEDNNMKLKGYFYEDIILDDLSVKGYDNYIIKISIKFNYKNKFE